MKSGMIAHGISPIGQNNDPLSRLVIDVNVLKSLIGHDEALVREFLQEFRVSTVEIATALSAACTSGEVETTTALAHKLKSSAHSVGALTLSRLCAALEHAGRQGHGAAQTRLLPEFERELERVGDFLDRY